MKFCIDRSIVVFAILLTLVIGYFYFNPGLLLNNYKSKNEEVSPIESPSTIIINNEPEIQRSPYEINSLDRFYNPLRFPYKTLPSFNPHYNSYYYPNLQLPSQVVGCGARNIPCLGGSQIPINNPVPTLNVSSGSIAPINIRTRGPIGVPQQVGVISRILGSKNEIYPLFGRRKYPNDNKWQYYTMMGKNNSVKIPLVPKNNNFEIGENDIISLKNQHGKYRVTLYENDFPQYIPYF